MWDTTPADVTVNQPCAHGGVAGSRSMATRQCNAYGLWDQVNLTQCLTLVQSNLLDLSTVSLLSSKWTCEMTVLLHETGADN